MKFRKDKDILRFFGIGLGVILLGIFMCIFLHPHGIGAGFILVGLIMLVIGLYTSTKPKGDTIMDERFRKINERAGYQAFWITLSTMAILWYADIFLKLRMEYRGVYSLIICVGVLSFVIFRIYYNKKEV